MICFSHSGLCQAVQKPLKADAPIGACGLGKGEIGADHRESKHIEKASLSLLKYGTEDGVSDSVRSPPIERSHRIAWYQRMDSVVWSSRLPGWLSTEKGTRNPRKLRELKKRFSQFYSLCVCVIWMCDLDV